MASSGSGAMEAAVSNFTTEGDEIAVIVGGKFGQRWQQINQAYLNRVHTLEVEWGEAVSPEKISDFLSDKPNCKAIFFQASETSTGVKLPVREIANHIRSHFRGLIIVDAISYLIAHEMKMDEWGIDVVISGSQKGFGVPAGLSFLAYSDLAFQSLSRRPRFYFDLRKEIANQKSGKSSWTPATSLILSLDKSLENFEAEGYENIFKHHEILAKATRNAIEAMGLELLAKRSPSNTLTAVKLPSSIDGKSLVTNLKEQFGTQFAGGQDSLSGKIIRISHLGLVDVLDMMAMISSFEMGLAMSGYQFEVGLGVKTALNTFISNQH